MARIKEKVLIVMKDGNGILKIVKEDVLRILGERNGKESSELIEDSVRASHNFVSEAIKSLEKENLIYDKKNFIRLTKSGQEKAKDIVKKHLVLEDYFKRTKSEKDAHEASNIFEHYVSEEVIKNIKKISTFKESGVPLIKLGLKREGIISDINITCDDLFERMVSMGIFPGEKIRLTNEIPGSVIFRVKNKKFAIDKNIAKEIKVLKNIE
mgnify:CR=1 FL=1